MAQPYFFGVPPPMEVIDLYDVVADNDEIKEAAVDLKHGKKAVTVHTRHGKQIVCPHCAEYLKSADIYTDKKGWHFCRACFRKGKGAICLDETEKTAFAFEYELPPDEDEFDLDKIANFTARGFQVQNPGVNYNSRSITESRLKNMRAGNIGMQGATGDIDWPSVANHAALLTPLAGAGIGYLTSEDDDPEDNKKLKGALKGLTTGIGAVSGAYLGSKLSGGDVGTGIAGTAGGGLLAYLLAKGLAG